ncbi:MAG: hypothetical protein WC982_12820 [Advenella sp.]
MPKFSKSERNPYKNDIEPEITIRDKAPKELRWFIVEQSKNAGLSSDELRSIICETLLKRPDSNNWSNGNIYNENVNLLDQAEWYQVYDVIEAISEKILPKFRPKEYLFFEKKLNDYFIDCGIGWKLVNGKLECRNPEALEQTIKTSIEDLKKDEKLTSSNQLHEALKCLSRRPVPNNVGAIFHSFNALEGVVREFSGGSTSALGTMLKNNKEIFPIQLGEAITKLYAFANNEGARHGKENVVPKLEEAQLVVGICATLSTYLINKNIKL